MPDSRAGIETAHAEKKVRRLCPVAVAGREDDNGEVSDWPDNWDELEPAEAPEAEEVVPRRRRIWIIWVVVGFVLLLSLVWYVWVTALLNPDNYRGFADLSSSWQGGEDQIETGGDGRSGWLQLWIGGHLLLQVVALVLIIRRRHSMSSRLVAKWSLLVLFVPFAGVLGFYFYLLEGAVQRGVPGRQEETASFLRTPRQGM